MVDTDVLIWHLRGYRQASRSLDELPKLTLSAMSREEVLSVIEKQRELEENLRDAFRLMAMDEVPQDYKTKQIAL